MTITFPRAMPSRGVSDVTFDLDYQEAVAAEQGGRLVSIGLGLARWRMTFRSATLDMTRLGEWRAWITSLRGAGRTFIGVDPARRFPLLYPAGFTGLTRAGGGSFDGSATSYSLNTARDDITLNGLPASFALRPGDMIELGWSSRAKRTLHRCLESATANGSGVATVQIEPPVPAYVTSATARLDNPGCIMRLLPGQQSASVAMNRSGQISFEAIQHLEA